MCREPAGPPKPIAPEGKRGPRSVETATAPLHENAAVERREARAPIARDPSTPRKRAPGRAQRPGGATAPGACRRSAPLAICEGLESRAHRAPRRRLPCEKFNPTTWRTDDDDNTARSTHARAGRSRRALGAQARGQRPHPLQRDAVLANVRKVAVPAPTLLHRRTAGLLRAALGAVPGGSEGVGSWPHPGGASRCNKGRARPRRRGEADGISEIDRSEGSASGRAGFNAARAGRSSCGDSDQAAVTCHRSTSIPGRRPQVAGQGKSDQSTTPTPPCSASCRGSRRFGNAPESDVREVCASLDQRRLFLRRLRRGRVLQPEDPPRVVIEQLLLVGLRQPHVLEKLQARRRIPARIVGAVHHVIEPVIVDRELHAGGVRRHRVGVHALEVLADRPRQLGGLRVLVHPAGLVRQRAAGVRHHDLEVRMPLHGAGQHQPHRGGADLDDAAEAEMQRAVVAVRQHVLEDHVGRVQEQRQSELLAMRVERLQPLGVDAGVGADRAGQVDAHQAEPVHRVVDHLDRDLGVLQRHRGAGPQPARILLLRGRHLLVPHQRVVAAFSDRHVGERHRERPDRADHVDPVAEAVHVFELLVEIEPLGPGVQVLTGIGAAHVVVAAALVDLAPRVVLPRAELVENRARPPMEMGIDDVHGAQSCKRPMI